jgi:hypothetical protein
MATPTAEKAEKQQPQPAKPRAGRRPYDPGPMTFGEWWDTIAVFCGECAGWLQVWCPHCLGFGGCAGCAYTNRVPCPSCAGRS